MVDTVVTAATWGGGGLEWERRGVREKKGWCRMNLIWEILCLSVWICDWFFGLKFQKILNVKVLNLRPIFWLQNSKFAADFSVANFKFFSFPFATDFSVANFKIWDRFFGRKFQVFSFPFWSQISRFFKRKGN